MNLETQRGLWTRARESSFAVLLLGEEAVRSFKRGGDYPPRFVLRGMTTVSPLATAPLRRDTRPSMAFDLEDFVRSGYARFSAGERIPTLEYWHADGEFTSSSDDPDHATYHGIEAIQDQYRRWVDSYPDLQVQVLELRVNGDRAFAWVRFFGHGAGSGVPIEMELAHVLTIEDGKIRRMGEFFDRAEGLEAAGFDR
jgi:ketosteroid isomerase-like protein